MKTWLKDLGHYRGEKNRPENEWQAVSGLWQKDWDTKQVRLKDLSFLGISHKGHTYNTSGEKRTLFCFSTAHKYILFNLHEHQDSGSSQWVCGGGELRAGPMHSGSSLQTIPGPQGHINVRIKFRVISLTNEEGGKIPLPLKTKPGELGWPQEAAFCDNHCHVTLWVGSSVSLIQSVSTYSKLNPCCVQESLSPPQALLDQVGRAPQVLWA